MLAGTEREVLELLLDRPRSPTTVAKELDVSVQTASRNLKKLVENGYAEQTSDDTDPGYKQYRASEFAHVLAGYDGELFEQTLSLSADKKVALSVWKIPQPEFHPPLMSLLFAPDVDRAKLGITSIVVYGSVARGTAEPDSDIDVLFLYDPSDASRSNVDEINVNDFLDTVYTTGGGIVASEREKVISEMWYSTTEFQEAVNAGSQFLRNVLDEGIILYDSQNVVRDARSR